METRPSHLNMLEKRQFWHTDVADQAAGISNGAACNGFRFCRAFTYLYLLILIRYGIWKATLGLWDPDLSSFLTVIPASVVDVCVVL